MVQPANNDPDRRSPASAEPGLQIREEFEQWLANAWDPSLGLREWRERLVDSGWAVPSWNEEHHGRGLPGSADQIVKDLLTEHGAVGLAPGAGTTLVAPTLRDQASEELTELLLRPTLTGDVSWCQLFSEPGAGSDLAGLTTKAVRAGDSWAITGQKLWSTSADHADYGLLLARTDPTVSKHAGITCFVLPMKQDSIEARPVRQMNDHSSFNEVFLEGAEVPDSHIVGEVGGGWTVALTALHHERIFGGLGRPPVPDSTGLAVEEARREHEEHMETYRWYPQRQGRVDLVLEALRRIGGGQHPVVRDRIMELYCLQKVSEWTAQRAADQRRANGVGGAESSVGKLATSKIARCAAAAHALVAGPDALLTGTAAPGDGVVAEVLLSVPAQSIAGGTDEIQRNIIGERVLGLPRS